MAVAQCLLLAIVVATCLNGLGFAEDCSPMEFACSGGCIPARMVCDTESNCLFGEDEKNCPTDCSGPNQFKCSDQRCIPSIRRCDRYNDCGDFSDEADCHAYECPDLFDTRCRTSRACLRKSDLCDGYLDCDDHSDETNCVSNCTNGFMCANRQRCVPQSWKCDGDNDCLDKSDEMGCHCDTTKMFKCKNNICLNKRYRCDKHNDCGDMSDEEACDDFYKGSCVDLMTFEDCVRMNLTAHPICTIPADAHKLCRKYCGIC